MHKNFILYNTPLLQHSDAVLEKWCSRRGLHLHWRRSRRRVSTVGLRERRKLGRWINGFLDGWEMEPPAGAAPAELLYKTSLRAAAWRRSFLNNPIIHQSITPFAACLAVPSAALGTAGL
jgi:hypothetical protein